MIRNRITVVLHIMVCVTFLVWGGGVFKGKCEPIYFVLSLFVVGIALVVWDVRSDRKNVYSEGGKLEHWYDYNLEITGVDWMVKAIEVLKLWENDTVIVDVSANKGICDKWLAEEFEKKGLKSEFLIFDKEKVRDHIENYEGKYVRLTYTEEVDGYDIVKTMKNIGVKGIDILWDVKGCLWYARRSSLEVLKNYHEVLNKDGILIVDNMQIKLGKAQMNKWWGEIRGKFSGYAEVSTVYKLSKHRYLTSEEWKEVKTLYEIREYEVDREKKIGIMVFRKREI